MPISRIGTTCPLWVLKNTFPPLPPKFNRCYTQNLQQERAPAWHTDLARLPRIEVCWSQRSGEHSAFALCHFRQVRILCHVFSSPWLSFQIAERKRSYAQISTPKRLCSWEKQRRNTKQPSLPPQFCASITPRDKGHSCNSFVLLSERTHEPSCRGPSGRFSGVSEQEFIIA